MKCKEVEELAGAYALDALPAETLREVREHLESCQQHPEIAGLRAAALSLAAAAPGMEPPPGLKTRLMDEIRQETARAAEGRPREIDGSWLRRYVGSAFRPYALAGALAIAVAALIGWNVYLQTSGDGGQDVAIVRALTDSGAAQGRVLYFQEEGVAVITVEDLAPLPTDQTYQVWAISGDDVATGIGLFNTSASGEASTALEVDLTNAEFVAITIEPAGGSPQPTSDPVLMAQI